MYGCRCAGNEKLIWILVCVEPFSLFAIIGFGRFSLLACHLNLLPRHFDRSLGPRCTCNMIFFGDPDCSLFCFQLSLDGFKKLIRTRSVEKFSISSPRPISPPPHPPRIFLHLQNRHAARGRKILGGCGGCLPRLYAEFFDMLCPNRFLKSVNYVCSNEFDSLPPPSRS